MIKFNRASGKTSGMTACQFALPVLASKLEFGFVQPSRFVKSDERPLVYRLPAEGKQWAVSKTLVFLLALFLAAFATGYVSAGHVPEQSGRRIQSASAVPEFPFHRVITISAVQGANNFPINTIPGDKA